MAADMRRSALPPTTVDQRHVAADVETAPARNRDDGLLRPVPEPEGSARAERSGAPHSLGLVYSETSGQEAREAWIRLGRKRRLGRMRRGVVGTALIMGRLAPLHDHWCAFITTTYRNDADYSPRHISDFCKRMRRYLERENIVARYVWVLELTRAGKAHYHMAVWLPNGTKLPKPDEEGWWPHGSTRIEKARRPVGYLIKYTSKGTEDDRVPKGARLWGCGGLQRDGRAELRWRLLPGYVQRDTQPGEHVIRFKGVGGWLNLATGQWWPPALPTFRDGEISWEEWKCSTPGLAAADTLT